jgi:cytochrome c oxidase subunit IV
MQHWSEGMAGWSGIGVGVALFAWIGIFVSRKFHRLKWQGAAGVYTGIVAGVIVDVVISTVLGEADRNLFPIEIMMWWVVATGGLLLASALGEPQGR